MTERRSSNLANRLAACLVLSALAFPATARAEMVLSKVVVELGEGRAASDDIEVWNDGPETIYVVAEPSEIVSPGTVAERRERVVDPTVSGLLVSPQRLVLQPGQRRQVRIAHVLAQPARDRVYRVTIKPVAGALVARGDAVKVFVGYDVLAIVRSAKVAGEVKGVRVGRTLRFENSTNTSWEIYDGRQCDASGRDCIALPATRLYSGAEWKVELGRDTRVAYKLTDGRTVVTRAF